MAFSVALQRASDYRVTDWDILIDYLERDPYTQSSGYTKQKILRRLKRAPLTESQRERLREMLLLQVTRSRRREWQEYSRLALVLDTPTFRERLRELVEREGTWAQAMLGALQTVNGKELC
ncbi:hypothetical protein [Armatimonas rosea]|uniref:Uncharacterized protein n=1 Tax=Armatimonas rosea TaxID=685828 RepID=A0A7W9W6K8_ARMRO|nr:hypothetical protein [Armatimonas rosea]MBB6051544.1 hypothetical protein [Armatimonas rosea]